MEYENGKGMGMGNPQEEMERGVGEVKR